ncbi:MAG: 23S rRNA (adenine(2503)-C(2))-methyltransferase RlmN [Lachnospiraceae bacterium]
MDFILQSLNENQAQGNYPGEGVDIKSMTLPQLTAFISGVDEKAFRAKQLYQWMHQKLAADFDEMSNLPTALRTKLKEKTEYTALELIEKQVSKEDGTRKYLFRLEDGQVIESVLMKYKHGNSICISSQAGCRMGCTFCASALNGLQRNLRPSEMLDQIYRIQRDSGERISNIVVMGTGEPLDNYDNLIRFLSLISDENGLNISQRHITVSTCGIVPRIYDLAKENLQITLALSLHAPTQAKRQELLPIAKSYGLDELMESVKYYFEQTGRRITIEYSLVKGKNDTSEDAAQLSALLKNMNCHVNLIPVNPIKEREYVQPDQHLILAFKNKLEKNGINVTIRREMGRDIEGACGQLRKSYMER